MPPLEGYTFQGYRCAGGVGTKNILGLATTVQCVAPTVEYAAQRIRAELLPRFKNVDGVVALRASLATHGDQFIRVIAEKLLTYALGRGVEFEDMPTVRSVVREAGARKYAFSALVMAIVRSQPFQMNAKGADAVQTSEGTTPASTRAAR